jgi:hypothetical protein
MDKVDKGSASKIIRDTFEQPFEKDRFLYFAKNLLNKLDESRAFHAHGYVPESFKEFVKTYERLGTYTAPDDKKIDILIVYLQKESSLERARTAQRNFIARYLKERDEKEAGLVAFVSPDSADWRFSLVKMEYRLEEAKVRTELSPARRWSFLVGSHESSHTAQRQLLPVLIDDKNNPLLAQLESAFNIEVVTKEFFGKYRELYWAVKEALEKLVEENEAIRKDFTDKGVDIVNFSKKLLGQIVFLYFLQKKGWFGVERDKDWGTGPRNFLRLLFAEKMANYRNFFNDILEPLFYEALATERTEDFYSRFNCKIPFLNGGLFDPINNYDWIHTDILLPNKLFSNSEKTKEGDTGTGILDVFDRYNFTVKEDEPLEKEVAIDPEMLGKVFENLLEVKDRKSKGTYYTPREIVHYMCQESLINYLDTAINTGESPLTQVTPPQGKLFGKPDPEQATLKTTGYKPVVPGEDIEDFIRRGELAVEHDARVENHGKETDTYSYKVPETIRKNAELLDVKLKNIRVCDPAIGSGAFPVGMMTEIVRARNVLTTYLPPNNKRTNYYFKRHAIQNCLYGVDIDAGAVEIAKLRLWLSLVVDEDDIRQIQPLPNLDYKIVCGNSLLKCEQDILYWPLFDELEKLKEDYFDEASKSKKEGYKQNINTLLARIEENNRDFNYTVNFSEVFPKKDTDNHGFDVVIANPPYIRHEQITELKPDLKKYFGCYNSTADIYVYFYERGKQILKKNGTLTYISSNKYFRAGYGEKLRRFLGNNCQICQIIDFGDAPVFEALAYPSIIVLRNAPQQANAVRVFTWNTGAVLEEFASIVQANSSVLSQNELTAAGWRLEPPIVLRLLDKLRRAGKPLGEYVNGRFYRGILTGLNEAFIVDRTTRDRLIAEHRSSAELLKPYLRGKDIKRWKAGFAEQYLIKIESSENIKHQWSAKSAEQVERAFAHTYPSIHKWFDTFRPKLIQRDDQGKYFWELRSCKYWEEFDKIKIVWGNLAKQPQFSFAEKGFYINAPANIIVSDSKYLLGILNSQVTRYLVSQSAAERQGGFLEYKPMYISPLAIPAQPQDEGISLLVGQILAITKDTDYLCNPSNQAKVKELERQIDQLVYQLYGLTVEEIAVVEGSAKK